ncbi:hypothetical protein ACFLTC_00860 [Chloroflexota bacterium]
MTTKQPGSPIRWLLATGACLAILIGSVMSCAAIEPNPADPGRQKEVRGPVTNSGAQHSDISQITENLYISSRIKDEHLEDVLQLDPDLIISMVFERRPHKALTEEGLPVLWLRTVDFVLIPIPLRTLNRGVEAALPVIQDGGRVLVFCQGGRHRSVAMASSILIGLGYSAEEAMQLISSKREVADPYAWHIQRQIRRFEAYWLRHKNQEQ